MDIHTQAGAEIHVQRKVLNLFLHAAKAACAGRMPSRPERNARSVVEETPNGVLMRWDGQPVLSVSSTPQGIVWEFMGAAAGAKGA